MSEYKAEFREISELIELAIDGSISVEQAQLLNDSIINDAAFRRFYCEYIQLNIAIERLSVSLQVAGVQDHDEEFIEELWNQMAADDPRLAMESNVSLRGVNIDEIMVNTEDSDKARVLLEILDLERTSPAVELPKPKEVKPKRELIHKVESTFKWFPSRPSKRKIRALLAMAACIMVVFGYMHFFAPKQVDRPVVAKLSESLNVEWDNDLQTPGQSGDMVQNKYRLEKGYSSILFNEGALVTVEAPAEFSLNTTGNMELFSGRMYAIVPERAIGFTVKAASSKIVDLGTEFGVEIDHRGDTQLHVTNGSVKLIAGLPDDKKTEFKVDAGSAKKIYNDGFVKDLPLVSNKFARKIDPKTGVVRRKLFVSSYSFDIDPDWKDYSGRTLIDGEYYIEGTQVPVAWRGHISPTITFDLGGIYDVEMIDLYSIKFWSSWGGIKSVDISASRDGVNYTPPVNIETKWKPSDMLSKDNRRPQVSSLDVAEFANARFYRLTLHGHKQEITDGVEMMDLSEIDFNGTAVVDSE